MIFKDGSYQVQELLIKNKGGELKFKIYEEGTSEGYAVYLDVEEVRALRDYLTSVLPLQPSRLRSKP